MPFSVPFLSKLLKTANRDVATAEAAGERVLDDARKIDQTDRKFTRVGVVTTIVFGVFGMVTWAYNQFDKSTETKAENQKIRVAIAQAQGKLPSIDPPADYDGDLSSGIQAFKEGNSVHALGLFQSAYQAKETAVCAYWIGRCYRTQQDFPTAEKWLQLATGKDASFAPAIFEEAGVLYDRGIQSFNDGNQAAAGAQFRHTFEVLGTDLAIDPKNYDGLILSSKSAYYANICLNSISSTDYMTQGQVVYVEGLLQAADYARRAIDMDHDSPDGWRWLTRILSDQAFDQSTASDYVQGYSNEFEGMDSVKKNSPNITLFTSWKRVVKAAFDTIWEEEMAKGWTSKLVSVQDLQKAVSNATPLYPWSL